MLHPGYGFLSENAAFARSVVEAGLTWVGPSPDSIAAMGSKTESAPARCSQAGVPIVPGMTTPARIRRGDRRVRTGERLPAPPQGGRRRRREGDARREGGRGGRRGVRARRGARRSSYFADDARVRGALRRAPAARRGPGPRRRDRASILAVGERECSLQRRHQKVLEECPSAAVSPELRARMEAVAVAAAKSVDYVSAGTVEFLLAKDGRFFFLEMNTRIQVEHPVTEMVYGVDLVAEMIRIARGEPMSLRERSRAPRGHAIECRVYAEDPARGFAPSPGPDHGAALAAAGPGSASTPASRPATSSRSTTTRWSRSSSPGGWTATRPGAGCSARSRRRASRGSRRRFRSSSPSSKDRASRRTRSPRSSSTAARTCRPAPEEASAALVVAAACSRRSRRREAAARSRRRGGARAVADRPADARGALMQIPREIRGRQAPAGARRDGRGAAAVLRIESGGTRPRGQRPAARATACGPSSTSEGRQAEVRIERTAEGGMRVRASAPSRSSSSSSTS